MSLAELSEDAAANATERARFRAPRPPRDRQRTFQLTLATVWLLDAVLQIQPFMFTPGDNGFSGMLKGLAAGNPGVVAHSVTWNASIVDHHPVLTNTAFAAVQFLIAFGIIYPRTIKAALGLSVVWSVGVWWFGEAAGQVFQGGATPFGGGPGGVLFYAVLAVLLWPGGSTDEPFVAARTLGLRNSRIIWASVWGVLAVLCVVGNGRSSQALHDLVSGLNHGQPGWLAHIDRSTESVLLHHGTTAAILLAVISVFVAGSVYLPARFTPVSQFALVTAMVVFALIWVCTENFGGILAGGATDPNSGPLVILLVLAYWPLTNPTAAAKEA